MPMEVNIEFQICGLVLVLLVMYLFYTKNNVLKLMNQRVYSALLISVMINLILDIQSVVAISYREQLPAWYVLVACKLYLISLIHIGNLVLTYVYSNLYRQRKVFQKKVILPDIILVIGEIAIITLPIDYYSEGRAIYSKGYSVMATYIIGLTFIILSALLLIIKRKEIGKKHREAIWFLLIVWTSTAALQGIYNEFLLLGFSVALGCAFLFLRLENPDDDVDKQVDVLNQNALHKYLEDVENTGAAAYCIALGLSEVHFLRDTFGSENIKELLKDIAEFLHQCKMGKVFLSREFEFTVVLSEQAEAEEMVEKITKRFENKWDISGVPVQVEIAMCYYTDASVVEGQDIYELLRYYMTEAKKRGKQYVLHITKEEIEEKVKQEEAEKSLRWALENDKLEVYYQPIYSIVDRKYTSAEVLVRLWDQNGKMMFPDIFIPIAEKNGLIVQLGDRVFEKVCQFMANDRLKEYGIEYLEINLSVVQCMQENLAEQLIATMEKYNISPNTINLEITETAAVNSADTLLHNMNTLIQHGVTFSLDDYGTGYSNLNYVIGLPVHIVKFDKELVWSYFKSEKAKTAMEFAIEMVRHLGMKIVTEGIEDKDMLDCMEELGIDFIQGFYFSKPIKEEDFFKIIQGQKAGAS